MHSTNDPNDNNLSINKPNDSKPNDNKSNNNEAENRSEKWDFEDYAFAIATVLCVVPIILGISIAIIQSPISPDDIITNRFSIHRWWPFSWMSFMFAWSACAIKDVVDIKRGAEGADGDLEDAAEYALYVGITTIMLLIGIIMGQMYSSWLAGPIVFVLLAVIWPLLRNSEDNKKAYFPTVLFILLLAGIVVEVVVGGWIAFPVSWILISAVKLYKTIRTCRLTEDVLVDIIYNAFSIILLTISLIWGSWIISWLAYPVAVIIGKIMRGKKDRSA